MDETQGQNSPNKSGRRSTLTMAIALELERHWFAASENILTDEEICYRVGITYCQLKGWLKRNRRPLREDGAFGGVGLRVIRERARGTLKLSYLHDLKTAADEAKAASDFRTYAQIKEWMAEKQFPVQFGNRQRIDVGRTADTGVAVLPDDMSMEDWEKVHRSDTVKPKE